MMGKAGAEKRPSQSLALHCSDRCAVQKEKYKDKCTTYRDKKGEYKNRFTIHLLFIYNYVSAHITANLAVRGYFRMRS